MRKRYPATIERMLTGDSIAAGVMLTMGIAFWFYVHSIITVLFGTFLASLIMIMRKRLLHRLQVYGYEWKRYRVIAYTYLSRWNRKPTGFIALSYNEGETLRRFHFALSDRMKTPELDAYVDVCIPGDVTISKVGRNFYVSYHYGIIQDGKQL